MLDSHPEIAVPPECHFLQRVLQIDLTDRDWVAQAHKEMTCDRRWNDYGIDAGAFRSILEAARPHDIGDALETFYLTYAARRGKPAWGDKSPGTLLMMPEIARAIPRARFVHIIRDGRDVAVSLRGRWWVAGLSHAELIADWAAQIRGARTQASGGFPYLEVLYEDLVAQPAATLRIVCAFIGFPFDDALLDYHLHAAERIDELRDVTLDDTRVLRREDRIAKHSQTLHPPSTERIGRWKTEMDAGDLRLCESAAGPLLRELGYQSQ